MNERIRELVKQAGFHPDSNWDHTDWHAAGHSDVFEKFAELIVRECTELCLKHAEFWGPFQQMEFRKGQHFNTIIKNHFGVKE